MEQEDINFSDFIASSIHDMKNSLSIQIGFLETLMDECQNKVEAATLGQLGHTIYEASRMNVNLIQILSLYKLGKSIYPVDIAEQSVRDVLEEIVLQNESIMAYKGIAVSVECAENCYWYFDRDLVTGVLVNALNNAYNYTTDKIRVVAQTREGMLEIRVEDNGRGYPESLLLENIAENKGISFATGSTGLGFYFSSKVAGMHRNAGKQGQLRIENGGVYGGGCFVLTLP
ncbi:MAG: HAMP domain-containing histidine kinase [Gallionellaceae bacterium]|nr:MAG: HAMP domain-containing histidine kinase [Gallionellaceae bacterium]